LLYKTKTNTKYGSQTVKLKLSLINVCVLPIMTYACALEAVSLTRGQYDELSVLE